jgi:four helix bundle protein
MVDGRTGSWFIVENMFTFEKLHVYQDSLNLASSIYILTDSWPKNEIFGLTGQIRRATVSISLNIAEGSGRTKKDFRHFLDMARASCQECIPLLEIAKRRSFIDNNEYNKFYENFSIIARQISALKRSVQL